MARDRFSGKDYVGLYGNVKIPKGWCAECEGHAFIIDGRLACCDVRYLDDPKGYKRESCTENRRYKPSIKMQKLIMEIQQNLCFYCHRLMGSRVKIGHRFYRITREWDHLVPFSYSQNNATDNFVAACRLCNQWKAAIMFATVEEARIYLLGKWAERMADATIEATED